MAREICDAAEWGMIFGLIVKAIPLAATDENEDDKVRRLAQYVGVSRSKLYTIMAGKPTKLISVEMFLRLVDLIPPRERDTRWFVWQKLSRKLGLDLERR